jgi:Protein of unknown function (DUF938)
MPRSGTILEIGSGTGQHVIAFAAAHPEVSWQPSDPDPAARRQHRRLDRRLDFGQRPRAARSGRHGAGLAERARPAAARHRLHQPAAHRAVGGLYGSHDGREPMPANNLSLLLGRR